MSRKEKELVFFALSAVILLFVLLNAGVYFVRIDLTESRTFTISEVSKSLFRELTEEVSITYYVTDKLRRFSAVPSRVEDLLYEYAAFSRGKIRVSVKDPEKTRSISRLEHFGLAPQQVQIIEQNEQSTALMYSGIVIEYLDDFTTLPPVFQTDRLEYDLTSTIRGLVRDERKVIGLLSGVDDRTVENSYRHLKNHLSTRFSVREVRQGEQIGSDLTVLLVLGCRDIDEEDLLPIDRYIMDGGRVLFAVSGVSVDTQNYFTAEKIGDSPALSFLSRNGIEVNRALLLDRYAKRIPVRKNQGGTVVQTLEWYPHWISVTEKNTSRENPITARFQGLDLLWPSPITVTETEGITAETIARSSDYAWLMSGHLNTDPSEARAYAEQADRTGNRYDLAVALSGSFTSFFTDRPVPGHSGLPDGRAAIGAASTATRLLVVASADFSTDLIQYSDSLNNLLFLENAVEWLSNDDDLLSIKTRSVRDVRLNRIEEADRKRMVLFYAEFLNIYFMPLVVVLAGVIRAVRRKERSMRLQREELHPPLGTGGSP